MSKKQYEYKKRLKHLDLKKIQAMDKLVGKIGIVVGATILLSAIALRWITGL